MTDDNDDAFAALAVGLNEDAKASRKRKPKADPVPEIVDDDPLGIGEDDEALDLSEGAHTLAIERMENMATDAVFETRSLVFEARDFLLDQIKSRPKPWSGTSNAEQRDVASACEHAANELVRKMVEAIAANGNVPIRALVKGVALGDEIKISLIAKPFGEEESDATVLALHRAHDKHVLITVASADDYKENAREPATEPDQPEMAFDPSNDDLNPDD